MKERIVAILQSHPKIGSVTAESNLLTDFGLSSLDIAELICEIEDTLDIEIPELELLRIKTAGDIFRFAEAM